MVVFNSSERCTIKLTYVFAASKNASWVSVNEKRWQSPVHDKKVANSMYAHVITVTYLAVARITPLLHQSACCEGCVQHVRNTAIFVHTCALSDRYCHQMH